MTEANSPWLIALTGGRGSGKTYVLAGLIDYLRREGRRVDGLLAEAEGRTESGRGADRYILRWPLHGWESLLCQRSAEGCPPYHFQESAWEKVGEWAHYMAAGTSPETLVLDEFGRLEARGDGLMRFWPQFLSARPNVMVIAVREAAQSDLESQMGRPFDLVVAADDPEVLSRLCELCASAQDWQRVGRFGAAAGAIEASLGSLLNVTRMPFRGPVMSGIQALILYYAGDRLAQPWRVIWIAYVASALKALSPAGNRLRPMVAIAMQGSLFGLAVRIFGWNSWGIQVGAWLVGAWSAMQGFVLQYLLMGRALLDAYGELQAWITQHVGLTIPSLPLFIALYAGFAGTIVSGAVAVLRWRRRPPELLARALHRPRPPVPEQSTAWHHRLWREYRQKAFWVPMVVVLVILALSGTSASSLLALSLRVVGIVAAIFVILSVVKPERWTRYLRRRGWWGAALAMERALGVRKGRSGSN